MVDVERGRKREKVELGEGRGGEEDYVPPLSACVTAAKWAVSKGEEEGRVGEKISGIALMHLAGS